MRTRRISAAEARRLAVTKQALAGPEPKASPAAIRSIAKRIRAIQVDPISSVARTEHLVLFSRLGPHYRREQLAKTVYERKELFHYWAHAASLVLTDDYPIHNYRMRTWPRSTSVAAEKVRSFLKDNVAMRRLILRRLRAEGPLRARDFEVKTSSPWRSDGWTHGQNVGRMLDFLWTQGKIMIVGRQGLDRLWGLADEWFPDWMPRDRWPEERVVEASVRHSLSALGVATRKQISTHFVRGAYPGLPGILKRLVVAGEIERVEVRDDGSNWPGQWFMLSEDVALLETRRDGFEPRTTLLSPFDNLICDRDRTEQFFDFEYRIEIYVPAAKRKYGYYVLPILHGDRLIGRIDSRFDRKQGAYVVENVYAQGDAPRDKATGRAVRAAIESMGQWLGAESISFGKAEAWSSFLR